MDSVRNARVHVLPWKVTSKKRDPTSTWRWYQGKRVWAENPLEQCSAAIQAPRNGPSSVSFAILLVASFSFILDMYLIWSDLPIIKLCFQHCCKGRVYHGKIRVNVLKRAWTCRHGCHSSYSVYMRSFESMSSFWRTTVDDDWWKSVRIIAIKRFEKAYSQSMNAPKQCSNLHGRLINDRKSINHLGFTQ